MGHRLGLGRWSAHACIMVAWQDRTSLPWPGFPPVTMSVPPPQCLSYLSGRVPVLLSQAECCPIEWETKACNGIMSAWQAGRFRNSPPGNRSSPFFFLLSPTECQGIMSGNNEGLHAWGGPVHRHQNFSFWVLPSCQLPYRGQWGFACLTGMGKVRGKKLEGMGIGVNVKLGLHRRKKVTTAVSNAWQVCHWEGLVSGLSKGVTGTPGRRSGSGHRMGM